MFYSFSWYCTTCTILQGFADCWVDEGICKRTGGRCANVQFTIYFVWIFIVCILLIAVFFSHMVTQHVHHWWNWWISHKETQEKRKEYSEYSVFLIWCLKIVYTVDSRCDFTLALLMARLTHVPFCNGMTWYVWYVLYSGYVPCIICHWYVIDTFAYCILYIHLRQVNMCVSLPAVWSTMPSMIVLT